jgi:outer membrane protein TolC
MVKRNYPARKCCAKKLPLSRWNKLSSPKERFDQQMATTTDVLDAQTLLSQARMNYNNALCDSNIDRAKLEKAMAKELN